MRSNANANVHGNGHGNPHGETTFGPATLEGVPEEGQAPGPSAWALTVLYHPDPARIGAQHVFSAEPGACVALSRLEPLFRSPLEGRLEPLGLTHLSRSPLLLRVGRGGIQLEPTSERVQLEVGAQEGAPRTALDLETLGSGVLLTLARRVTLMLHPFRSDGPEAVGTRLLGVSEALASVRIQLLHLAALPHPVLITGETGTGKELVAQALHALSPRSQARLVSVNMAALPHATAAAELFGHARGAFTGAADARPGLFREANGGTLFLDEIGETPLEIQPMLLRALEQREIQPLGSSPRQVDVRLVAATDADLEALVQSGRFRRPLLYRLAASTLELPPLRARRVDIPLLFVHFLREFLAEQGALHCLEPTGEGEGPWLRRREVLLLLEHAWPGNIRELRQVALQTVLLSHRSPAATLPPSLYARPTGSLSAGLGELGGAGGNPTGGSRVHANPDPSARTPAPVRSSVLPAALGGAARPGAGHLTEALIRSALEASGWRVMAAAEALGVSRNYLYTQMAELGIRNASSLSAQELMAARQAQPEADLEALATSLNISPRALRQRLKVLQLEL